MCYNSRPPHGGRGLKYSNAVGGKVGNELSPARGTWIEIGGAGGTNGGDGVVPRTGDVD